MNAPLIANERTPLQRKLADFRTPLLHNQWYVAGYREEFGEGLAERMFLNRSVVIYRTGAGEPIALQNRCAHRSYPLAKSWREGDAIRCRYHGAKFDSNGEMLEVPCQEHCPKVRLRKYPLREQGPLVWIWMGDEEAAEATPLPETPFLIREDGWEFCTGSFHMEGNYLLMMENLMDLTHLPFLHRDTFSFPPEYATIPIEVETDGMQLRYARIGGANNKFYHRKGFMPDYMVERFDKEAYHVNAYGEFVNPGFTYGRGELRVLEPREGLQNEFLTRVVHFLTPETDTTTHYWYFHARNYAQDDKAHTEKVRATLAKGFAEDMEAVADLQRLLTTDRHPFREVHYAGDKPTVAMRRLVARMAEAEYGTS